MDDLADFVASLLSSAGGRSWYGSDQMRIAHSPKRRLEARFDELGAVVSG